MVTPMLESELDDIVHDLAGKLDLYTDSPIDRYLLNDELARMFWVEFAIPLERN